MGQPGMDEGSFIAASREFLAGLLEVDGATLDPDANLVADGLVDSLSLLEYFDFIEQLRGEEIPAASVSFELLSTMRGAYRLLTA